MAVSMKPRFSATRSNPFFRRLCLPFAVGDCRIATEANDVVKVFQSLDELQERVVIETTVCQNGHLHVVGNKQRKVQDHLAFDLLPIALHLRLQDGLPHQWSRTPMAGDKAQFQGGLVVFFKISPVQDDDDLFSFSDYVFDPQRQDFFDIDALVAQQSIDLLDAVLARQAVCVSQSMPDGVDGQRCAGQYPDRRVAWMSSPSMLLMNVTASSCFTNFLVFISASSGLGLCPNGGVKQVRKNAVSDCWIKSITYTENLK